MSERFLSFKDLRPRGIPWCRLHVNRLIKKGIFPPAVWLSPNRKVWREQDIDNFLASRPTSRPAFPPEAIDAAE